MMVAWIIETKGLILLHQNKLKNRLADISKGLSVAFLSRSKAARFFFLVLFLTAALISLLLFYVPKALDDLWFLDGITDAPGLHAFSSACAVLVKRLSTDTGRLGAIISPVFLALLPKWVYNILTGFFFILLGEGSRRLARVRAGGLWSFLILAICLLALPWYDYLLILTYGINYIWAAACAVWSAALFLRPESLTSRRRLWFAATICFIAGWMHEGFGIPLSAAAVAILVFPAMRRRRLLPTAATIAGTAMTALSPAIWNRLAYTESVSAPSYPLGEAIYHFGPLTISLIVFTIALFVALRRRRRFTPDMVFFSVFNLVAASVSFMFYCGPRITTPAILFSLVGAIHFTAPFVKPLPRKLSGMVSLLLSAAFMVHLVAAIQLQRELMAQFRQVESLFTASCDGQIYMDLMQPHPDMSLYKTTVRQFNEKVPREMFSRYYDQSGHKSLTILPERLSGFEVGAGEPLRSASGLCLFEGCIVALPDDSSTSDTGHLTLVTADGTPISSRYRGQLFKTAGGDTCRLITPHAVLINPAITIADIRIER